MVERSESKSKWPPETEMEGGKIGLTSQEFYQLYRELYFFFLLFILCPKMSLKFVARSNFSGNHFSKKTSFGNGHQKLLLDH